jgi:hypothetical protein
LSGSYRCGVRAVPVNLDLVRHPGGKLEDRAQRTGDSPGPPEANVPEPGSERAAWATAIAVGVLGVAVLALVLSGVIGRAGSEATGAAPPAVLAFTPTPAPSAAQPAGAVASAGAATTAPTAATAGASGAQSHAPAGAAIVGDPSASQAHRDLVSYEAQTSTHIPERWMQGFYPIYAAAQRTFGVNWLLIASIHKQESAFSTAPSTYNGLNFARCCGGPMQFNVKNGGPPGESDSTWALVNDSYRYGTRPASYDHMTARHPSIYDDFDAIMAAAHLLSADGAGAALDGTAWNAAYDYYGHDATGVTYADQVLARAIGWSQHGFCINCGVETALVEAVHATYGAPVAAQFETAKTARAKPTARSIKRRKH